MVANIIGYDKFAFHETRAHDLTITLVEKIDQEAVNARILAPRGLPIVHAFGEGTMTQDNMQVQSILSDAVLALENVR